MEPVIGAEDRIFANIKVTPDYKNILMFIENLKLKLGLNDTYDIECGYEAGCLGYSLYNQLTAPGERSSSDDINRLGLTKAGNQHLRLLLIESAGGICKGVVGHKSKDLRQRQNGNRADVIAYADKANTRLRSRYYKFIRHGKKRNVAVAAVARELACFIWGMMTDNISMRMS